jgi:RNA polymerase sigma factor (sigma-70 family)
MNSTEAAALSARVRSGDEAALTALLTVALPIARRTALLNRPTHRRYAVDTDELLGVAREAAWRACREYTAGGHSFPNFVILAVRRSVFNTNKTNARPRRAPRKGLVGGAEAERIFDRTPDPAPDPREAAEQNELRAFVAELPEPERAVVTALHLEGRSFRETAAVLDLSLQAVRSANRRGLDRLRAVYDRG